MREFNGTNVGQRLESEGELTALRLAVTYDTRSSYITVVSGSSKDIESLVVGISSVLSCVERVLLASIVST